MRKFLFTLLLLLSCCLALGAWTHAARAEQGIEYLLAAREAEAEHNPMSAFLFAAKAVGFAHFVDIPMYGGLLEPDSEEYGEALAIAERNKGYLLWSSPVPTIQYKGTLRLLAVSPDGRRLVAKGDGFALRVWDLESGDMLYPLEAGNKWRRDKIWLLTWDPLGTRLATGNFDGILRVWDVVNGGCVEIPRSFCDDYDSVIWSPEGDRILSAFYSRDVWIWDPGNGALLQHLGSDNVFINRLYWSPDGGHVAALSRDNADLLIWDLAWGRILLRLDLRGSEVADFAWSPDGSRFAAGIDQAPSLLYFLFPMSKPQGNPREIGIWDTEHGNLLQVLPGQSSSVVDLAWSPDGESLLSSGSGETRIWDTATGVLSRTIPGDIYPNVSPWSGDGSWVITQEQGAEIVVWDAESGRRIQEYNLGHNEMIEVWRPEDDTLMVLGAGGGHFNIHNASTAVAGEPEQGMDVMTSVAWSPDGTWLVSGDSPEAVCGGPGGPGQGHVRVWDAEGDLLRTWDTGVEGVMAVDCSPDGSRIVSGGCGSAVQVRDAESGHVLATWGRFGVIKDLSWSPDGTRVAILDQDNVVTVVDAASGSPLVNVPQPGSTHGMGWSPDGARLEVMDVSGQVLVWDAATGEPLQQVAGYGTGVEFRLPRTGRPVVAWKPDGKAVAAGLINGNISILDAASLEELLVLESHPEGVRDLAWSPDGTRLASVGRDLRVWSVAGGSEGKYDPSLLNYFYFDGFVVRWADIPLGGMGQSTAIRWRPEAEE